MAASQPSAPLGWQSPALAAVPARRLAPQGLPLTKHLAAAATLPGRAGCQQHGQPCSGVPVPRLPKPRPEWGQAGPGEGRAWQHSWAAESTGHGGRGTLGTQGMVAEGHLGHRALWQRDTCGIWGCLRSFRASRLQSLEPQLMFAAVFGTSWPSRARCPGLCWRPKGAGAATCVHGTRQSRAPRAPRLSRQRVLVGQGPGEPWQAVPRGSSWKTAQPQPPSPEPRRPVLGLPDSHRARPTAWGFPGKAGQDGAAAFPQAAGSAALVPGAQPGGRAVAAGAARGRRGCVSSRGRGPGGQVWEAQGPGARAGLGPKAVAAQPSRRFVPGWGWIWVKPRGAEAGGEGAALTPGPPPPSSSG